MIVNYVVYDLQTGGVVKSGICSREDLKLQPGEGQGVMETTGEARVVVEIDLTPIREGLFNKVDADAEAFCLRFMTAGATQAVRYMEKRTEAETWTEGADPADFPFLTLEAAATGVAVADLVATILENVAAWKAIGAGVEALRMAAKQAIAASTNLLEMNTASEVDWSSLLPPAPAPAAPAFPMVPPPFNPQTST